MVKCGKDFLFVKYKSGHKITLEEARTEYTPRLIITPTISAVSKFPHVSNRAAGSRWLITASSK
jgi:hypothetical protein